MEKLKLLLLTIAIAALTLGGCAADDAGESSTVESPTAVPGMEGETQATTGAAATEQ